MSDKTKKVRPIRATVSGLIWFLCLVSVSVVLTLNFRPLYYAEMKLLDISTKSGYSDEIIKENYDVLIDYNNIWYDGNLEFPDFPMSEEARIHFEEVKNVFAIFEYGAVVLLPLSLIIFVFSKRRQKCIAAASAAAYSIGTLLAAAILIIQNWELVFVTFHKLVFKNDYWIFDPVTDPVILILPDAFFMHCAVLIIFFILLGSAVFVVTWRKLKRRLRNIKAAAETVG